MRQAHTREERAQLIKNLPKQPGIYRMHDHDGKLLYVGKAKNLKNRVGSYFQKNAQHTPKTRRLVQRIATVDIIITDNEHEAFILEDNLIKTHQPPYNILLKDDKRYPWICITGEAYPRVMMTRSIRRPRRGVKKTTQKSAKDTHRQPRYFGPYTNVGALYDLMKLLKKHFPTRQRKTPLFPNRPCMNYSIGTCPGPCQKLITPEAYDATLRHIELLLKGHTEPLLKRIETEMRVASEAMNFEWAARLRDRYNAIKTLLSNQQSVNLNDLTQHLDAVGMAVHDQHVSFVVLRIRYGRMIDSHTFHTQLPQEASASEAYETFLHQYYTQQPTDQLPQELLLEPIDEGSRNDSAQDFDGIIEAQYAHDNRDWLIEWLTSQQEAAEKAGTLIDPNRIITEGTSRKNTVNKALNWHSPQRGKKQHLIQLAQKNATEALEHDRIEHQQALSRDPAKALSTLKTALNLPDIPRRIECYDISHIQGHMTVASMVVFIDGRADKSQYRRFNIQQAEGKPDDFLSMHEAMTRRFGHSERYTRKRPTKTSHPWPDPNLIIIDGGKGQLSSAQKALDSLGVTVPTVSLAKRLEELFLPNHPNPILLDRDDPALYLVQQLRDEAHRFAITAHRKRRGKYSITSFLDTVSGIGPARKRHLLKEWGSFKQLSTASVAELISRGKLPQAIAQQLHAALQDNKEAPHHHPDDSHDKPS